MYQIQLKHSYRLRREGYCNARLETVGAVDGESAGGADLAA